MNEQNPFFRDTWVEVNLDHIAANVSAVKGRLPKNVAIIAVVKANAYGHGDLRVAEAALQAGASMLAVAFLDEALSLRRKGISAPLLVLGASRPEDVNLAAREEIILTVFQFDWLIRAKAVLEEGMNLSVHVKVDTGMGRIGVRTTEELMRIEEIIHTDSRIQFAGIYTHFATADELGDHYFRKQLHDFENMISSLSSRPPCVHGSNSAAAIRYEEAQFDAVRLGIVMYGLSPSQEIKPHLPFPLKEAFSLHSRLSYVKVVKKGEKISYGGTYTAPEDEWIGTIPIGYADGWIRKLRGQEVLVNGVRCPIVGRICMDQSMVRLPNEMKPGTKVTLIGNQQNNLITVDEIADKLETINYEIPCQISSRVPRVYIKAGQNIATMNAILPQVND
ncbi:alanine racemase [Bacillus sp. B15-48]|uniref:alanine racemase n=1 Tax=Bacillus sp. B15-48 TaxID=1548601 RepID=UPI00193FD399|nr:alanine racemase [Bacillus sp. B15-48]MBM4765387.1 alanine racemase [Bacillus sp. B15-48]